MIKLYGLSVSNYYNVVKTALLEKGFDFEEVHLIPNQDADYLAKSPMGKIPCLEVKEGFLSESGVILDFLEEIQPDMPLLPEDPFARAKVREITQMVEKYLEVPIHPLVADLMGHGSHSDAEKDAIQDTVRRGLGALARLVRFDPWVAGPQFTYADIVLYFHYSAAKLLASAVLDWDIKGEIEGLEDWQARMSQRHFVAGVEQEAKKAMAALQENGAP